MSNFRGRAPSGLISRETGNYAWVGENGEIIVDGSHCLSDNGEHVPFMVRMYQELYLKGTGKKGK